MQGINWGGMGTKGGEEEVDYVAIGYMQDLL